MFLVTNARGVTWKRAVGVLSMLSEFPVADAFGLLFRDPFEFVTKSRMNKPKQWNWPETRLKLIQEIAKSARV
jgi:hypothetical protein